MMVRTPVSETACRSNAAPQLVIDEHGREVGVLLGHAEYVALLAHLAAQAERAQGKHPVPSAYWRRALATWIPGAAACPEAEAESR
jgi:hypothetical protein